MKKCLALLLLGILSIFSGMGMAVAEENASIANAVKTYGVSKVCNAYHQLIALIVEYPEKVETPSVDAYSVIDYDTVEYREAFNVRDQSEAPIVAVYTNDKPEVRENRQSVPGRFVVVELAEIKGTVEEDGVLKPTTIAGNCTWRRTTEAGTDGADWKRQDFSKLVFKQKEDVKNAAGEVVSPAGVLPTLLFEDLVNLEVDEFVSDFFTLSNGNQMYYSYWLPKNYDENRQYPMVVSLTGGGGTYRIQPNGDPRGAHITRDRGAMAWLSAKEDVIVLSPQQCNDPFKSTGDDVMEIVNYFICHYSIDPDRVTCIGSSAGGLTWSNILTKPEYAKVFAAYVPCNTHFNGAQTMYKEEYNVTRMEEAYGFNSYEDYLNPEMEMDDSEYYEEAKQALKALVDNKINVWIWHGYNDETASCGKGVSMYRILRRIYQEEGLSEDEINDLVKLTLIDTERFHEMGILSYHMASKVAVSDSDFIDWMLAQTRAD